MQPYKIFSIAFAFYLASVIFHFWPCIIAALVLALYAISKLIK